MDKAYQCYEMCIRDRSMNGVFMCGYPVFKEIYHLEVRKSARSTGPESLVLVTVVPMYSSQPDKNHSQMKDSMLTDVYKRQPYSS